MKQPRRATCSRRACMVIGRWGLCAGLVRRRRDHPAPIRCAPTCEPPGGARPAGAAARPARGPRRPRTAPGPRSTAARPQVLRRESAGVSTESALRGARASAALEGVDVPLADLRAGTVDDPLVQGALRVSAGLARWSRRGHGRPARCSPGCTCWPRPTSSDSGELGPAGAARRAPALRPVLPRHRDDVGPGLLVAAFVHGELAALAPFGSADGVVARAAARLTGITRGSTPRRCRCPRWASPSWAGTPTRRRWPRTLRDVRRCGRLAGALRAGHGTRCARGPGDLREPPARLSGGRPRGPRLVAMEYLEVDGLGPGQPDRAGHLAVRLPRVGLRRRLRRPRGARHRPAGARAGRHALRHRRGVWVRPQRAHPGEALGDDRHDVVVATQALPDRALPADRAAAVRTQRHAGCGCPGSRSTRCTSPTRSCPTGHHARHDARCSTRAASARSVSPTTRSTAGGRPTPRSADR